MFKRSVQAILFIAQSIINNATCFGKADFPRDNPSGFKGIGYFVDPKIGIEVEESPKEIADAIINEALFRLILCSYHPI